MAINVTNAHIESFQSNVVQLAQQSRSRLRGSITEVMKQSETHNWDRLAPSQARLKANARMVSPAGGDGSAAVGSTDGLDWSRRSTVVKSYDTGEVVEQENIVQMLTDPKNASTESLVQNMNRQVDDIIITAALGAANDGAGGSSALPAGQIVGDYSTPISLDFVLQVDEKFQENDVDPDESKFWVIGPKQRRQLLELVQVTSGDYQARQALTDGYLPNFMGFNWILSNRLNIPAAGQIDSFAFTKKGIGLHCAGDIKTRAAERPDMSFAYQLYLMMQMDAVRIEDEHVVHAQFDNS